MFLGKINKKFINYYSVATFMGIKLFIEPGKTYTWEQFKKEKPPFSIALDGLVDAAPKKEEKGPYANFDHHAGVDRSSTRATSEQVRMQINLGLFKAFKENNIPTANVYVNDCDEDTCLAWWLLKHHEQVINHASPSINRLVRCEDLLDTTAGSYPLGDTEFRRRMAWVFEPYNKARFEGRLFGMTASGMQSIFDSVEYRINQHVLNGGEEMSLEGQYEKIGGGHGWVMTKETGPASRMAMYNDGIDAFIAYLGENEGLHRYVAGRKEVWIPFPLDSFVSAFNIIDKEIVTKTNKWGGTNTIIGSPRATGSTQDPQTLQSNTNNILKEKYGL